MSTTTSSAGGASAAWPEGQTPYDRATLGFKNYWYPICLAKEVGKRPVTIAMLGEQLALFRRGDTVFALRDECAHRGIPLSLGKNEFPEPTPSLAGITGGSTTSPTAGAWARSPTVLTPR